MPVVGAIFGGLDFSSNFVLLGAVPAGYTGSLTDYAALKEAGAPMLGWGQFLTVVINFLILAFIIFLLVRSANKMNAQGGSAPRRRPIRDEVGAAARDQGRR